MIGGLRDTTKFLLRPFRPLWRRELEQQIRSRTGLLPIDEVQPCDIFIAGYPKSGNTWMQDLVAGLLFAMDMRYVPDRLVQSVVPDVHFRKYYRRYLPAMFFKTHALPQPEYRRVINLIRDGRDVMVSYLHHLEALQGARPDFLDIVTTGKGLFPCRWHEHVEAWALNPYNAEMITVRYEDLKTDTVAALEKICAFAGLQRDRSILEMVARTSTFEVMRTKEKTFGWDDTAFWPKDKAFVRRGATGSFKDEMPPDVLAAFMESSKPALMKAGYAID